MPAQQLTEITDPNLSTTVDQLVPGVLNGVRRITLGEGALWHAQASRFVYIDIEAPALCFYTPSSNKFESYNIHEILQKQSNSHCDVVPKIGTVVATSDINIYLLAIQHDVGGISMFNYNTHEITPYAKHPEFHLQNNRLNDGKVSADGKLYVGSMLLDTITPRTPEGSLYVVSGNNSSGAFSKIFDQVTISNGIVWSIDGSKMYYIDTPKQCVDVFDYVNGSVDINSRKTIIKTDYSTDGYPDGCCIDSDGMLWICFWLGSNISRYDPNTGKLLHRIKMPTQCITSCAFGGDNLGDLYVTSASNKVDISAQPQAGSVFIVRNVGVTGIKSPVYQFKSKL